MKKLNFFDPLFEESRLHKNFKEIIKKGCETQRNLFEEWASGFIDRDGKLVAEFQTTFNSTFWEIYLFATFRSYDIHTNFNYSSPDFHLKKRGVEFIVEATTANAARGGINEWEKTIENVLEQHSIETINKTAIVRLANALDSKTKKYRERYCRLPQVINRPYIVAIAPFEQPFFQLQYDRPIRALLTGNYVDESICLAEPDQFPDGPPTINLESMIKENGSTISLGVFNDDSHREISAIIFSCTATWGKVSAMDKESDKTHVSYLWGSGPNGAPEKTVERTPNTREEIHDGLMIFHNPHAINPLPRDIFRKERVVQHYYSDYSKAWVAEGMQNALLLRQTLTLRTTDIIEE